MRRVLIANRGAIARRIIRTCRTMGLDTVAVHAGVDEDLPHVHEADISRLITGTTPRHAYLDGQQIIRIALDCHADAVHPGYGFLSENPVFARQVVEAGLTWVGPTSAVIELMGIKDRARHLAVSAGVPVLPATGRIASADAATLASRAAEVGFPLLVKAVAGGGGIGLQRVDRAVDLGPAIDGARRAAGRSFGDDAVFLERWVEPARHVEVQVFGFGDGHVVHLHERDCSMQRRHQKVIEEAPAPGLSQATRAGLQEAACRLGECIRYAGAGTVEFLVEPSGRFYFLEMNTRIQVEHGVTELVCGLDLVGLQLRLAAGDAPLELLAEDARPLGHAVEARVYAEDPDRNFLPSPGTLSLVELPAGDPGIRIDASYVAGNRLTPHFDPMIAKVLAWAECRSDAIDRLARALSRCRIEGVRTNLEFLVRCLRSTAFLNGEPTTALVSRLAQARCSG